MPLGKDSPKTIKQRVLFTFTSLKTEKNLKRVKIRKIDQKVTATREQRGELLADPLTATGSTAATITANTNSSRGTIFVFTKPIDIAKDISPATMAMCNIVPIMTKVRIVPRFVRHADFSRSWEESRTTEGGAGEE